MEQEQKILINKNWKFMHGDFPEAKRRNMMIGNGMISGFRILLGFRISWKSNFI